MLVKSILAEKLLKKSPQIINERRIVARDVMTRRYGCHSNNKRNSSCGSNRAVRLESAVATQAGGVHTTQPDA